MPRALEWAPAAERDVRRLDHQTRERIRQAVYRLADTGLGDVVRLRGVAREWRLRVGDWRVRFTEDPTGQTRSAVARALLATATPPFTHGLSGDDLPSPRGPPECQRGAGAHVPVHAPVGAYPPSPAKND